MSAPTVTLIPAFTDNYFFGVHVGDSAFVVDPGHADEVLNYLKENNLKLKLILVTHHHADHIGGVAELQNKTGAKLFGPSDLIAHGLRCDRFCNEGDILDFEGVKFKTLALPGHTLDHLAYYSEEHGILFCGDTLFSLGCGRVYEGTYEQMHQTLSRLRSLPDATKVYCAHEYTLSNLKFTLQYLKSIQASLTVIEFYTSLQRRITKLREENTPTIPSTIGFEKQFNLFLKANSPGEFKRVREARNEFRANLVQTPIV